MENTICPPINVEQIKEQLKYPPEIILELNKCPMCNTNRDNGEQQCHNCGFYYVPVGFRYVKSTDKDFINNLFDQQRSTIKNKNLPRLAITSLIVFVVIYLILFLFPINNMLLHFIFAILPSIPIGFYISTELNKPYKNDLIDLSKREHDYMKMQLKWKQMKIKKEQMIKQKKIEKEIEKYGRFKIMTIDKWRKQATHNKYFPYMNMSVQESKITFYHEKGFIKYKNFFIKAADVIDCSLIDDGRGKVITKTEVKRKTSSVIGRAVVGQVVAGPVGAVIGGMTAKKKVENKEIEEHDYNIYITTTNIKTPLLKLEFGENTDNARKVYSMLMLTINTNK